MTSTAAERYNSWLAGRNYWASSLDQLNGSELDELVAEVGAVADQLEPGRAAFHSYDLVINAGDQGGAERVGVPLLRTLARRAGGYSHLAKPAPPRTSSRTVFRGGDEWRRCSWTPDRRIAQTYAESEREGDLRIVAAPVWRFEAQPGVLLAVVPAGLAGGPAEWVIDSSLIPEATRLHDDVPPLPRDARGRPLWSASAAPERSELSWLKPRGRSLFGW